MASTIQSQTIGSADKCIALAASQFGRAHGYGDNWNTLRIGLNWNVEDSGAAIAGSVLRVGLCHGTTNMPGDATTDNSYGIKWNPSWSRSAGPPVNYVITNTAAAWAFSRVGSVETTSLTSSATSYMFTVNAVRGCAFLDIIKGASYTYKLFIASSNTATDVTPTAFLALVGQTTPSRSLYTYYSPTGTGIAIDTGTNGILDTVYVGWNLLTPRIFISNLAVVRLA